MDVFVRVNCLVAGLVITAGLYAQTIKIFRTRSAKDIALILVVALFYNEVAWLWYGFRIHEWPIVALCAANIPADVGLFIGWWMYGKERGSERCRK